MDLNLQDKIIIVTGGAKGIGAGIVKALSHEKAVPVIVGRSEKEGQALAEKIILQGGKAFNVIKELGTSESCRSTIETILNEFGRIDGLVNNAGSNDSIGLEHGSPTSYLNSLEKNLHHYYFMAHYALASLKKSKGSILNISSKVALTGQGGTSAYAAAKGAQLAFTREWAAELLPYSIRVNAILPAEVMTPLYRNWLDTFQNSKEKEDQIKAKIPLGKRMTNVDEIASTAVFLLSEKSSHTTGQFFIVDGGYVHLDRSLT